MSFMLLAFTRVNDLEIKANPGSGVNLKPYLKKTTLDKDDFSFFFLFFIAIVETGSLGSLGCLELVDQTDLDLTEICLPYLAVHYSIQL